MLKQNVDRVKARAMY